MVESAPAEVIVTKYLFRTLTLVEKECTQTFSMNESIKILNLIFLILRLSSWRANTWV